MTLEEQLQKEVNELERFVEYAKEEIAFRKGRIAVLKDLIKDEKEVKDDAA